MWTDPGGRMPDEADEADESAILGIVPSLFASGRNSCSGTTRIVSLRLSISRILPGPIVPRAHI